LSARGGGPRPAALAAVGLLAVATFFVALAADWPAVRLVAKPLPALLLAAWVGRRRPDVPGRLVATGLLLSACGDLVLEMGLFLPGLVAFLLAHVAYTGGFVGDDPRPALSRALPFVAYGLGVFAVLRPGLGDMAVPVAAYVVVICTMTWRAAARVGGRRSGGASWIGLAGALAFAASDTVIAFDRFHAPVPGARWAVMALYWLGQWGIAASAATAAWPGHGMLRAR
jgi:alkenylglycerophosphocholine/alkenylglycerophosphoethanolamine hydrolase